MPLFGAHMSIAGGYHKAVEEAHSLGMDCVQLFTKNNSQWRAKIITAEEEQLFAAALTDHKIQHPISHASYLINLASPDPALRQKSIDGMVVELARAAQLGIPYVIVHPGAHTVVCEEEGLANIAASINEIHLRLAADACLTAAPTRRSSADALTPQITLELTAGQGSCLGCRIEQLAAILDQVAEPDRVGVCLDTCHVFAAGYDLRDRKAYLAMWRQFDDLLGLGRLKAIHLNDSKRELGSRVDRHEHIGRGHIGEAGFRHILRDRRLKSVPMYLETPKGDHAGEPWDTINLRTLRNLARP